MKNTQRVMHVSVLMGALLAGYGVRADAQVPSTYNSTTHNEGVGTNAGTP